jgi:hypothetical protein
MMVQTETVMLDHDAVSVVVTIVRGFTVSRVRIVDDTITVDATVLDSNRTTELHRKDKDESD